MMNHTGDMLQRRAEEAHAVSMTVADQLHVITKGARPRGKSGRALTAWIARDAARDPETASSWRRIPVGRGVELHIETAHPLARLGPDDPAVAEGVRQALATLLPPNTAARDRPRPG